MTPQRRYILHIDDDEDDKAMLQEVVKETDPSLHIRTARNGQEGLELLLQCLLLKDLPCLIILDLNMPGMDGKQVLIEIRRNAILSSIPVVLFTTSSSQLDKLFASQEKVELITKPSSGAAFAAAVKRALEQVTKMSAG